MLTFKNKSLFNNFFWRSIQLIGRQGILFIIFFISAKYLIPSELGKLSYLLSIISLLAILADFGLSTAVSKYTAEYSIQKDGKLKISKLFFSSVLLSLVFTLLIVTITILFGRNILVESYTGVVLLLPLIFLIPVQAIFDGIFRGLNSYRNISIVTIISGVISIPIAIFLVRSYGLQGAMWAQLIFYLIGTASVMTIFKYYSLKFDKNIVTVVLRYAAIIGLVNLSYFFLTRISTTILGFYGYNELAGYFEIINRIMTAIINVFATVGVIIATPNIHLYLSESDELRVNFKKNIKIFLLMGILVTFCVIVLTPIIVWLLMSQYFNYDFLIILICLSLTLPSYILEAVISNGYITPLGYAKILLQSTIVGGLLNLLFAILLIPIIGPFSIIILVVLINNLVNYYKIKTFYNEFMGRVF